MRKYIVSVLSASVIFITTVFSQGKYILAERFNNNYFGWYEGSNEKMEAAVSDGFLNFEHKRESGYWCAYTAVPLQEEKDFQIQASIKQISGVDKHGYGLLWGTLNADNNFSFIISSNGSFRIAQYVNAKFSALKDWTKSEWIKPMNQVNVLSIVRKGGNLSFLINQQEVYSCGWMKFMGTKIGFMVNEMMKIAVDEITVKQNENSIVLGDTLEETVSENVGGGINSAYADLSPVISPDGKTFFITRYPPGNSDKNNIWFSTKNDDGTWSKAMDIGTPLNVKGANTSVNSVTPDGNQLLLSNIYNYFDGTLSGGGCSVSFRQRGGWSFPKKQTIDRFENINDYVDYFLTNDGQTMLMSIETKGKENKGKRDIYVSFRKGENDWSKPKNLGPVINTVETDIAPFMAADGVTLYYSTSGHGGYGNNDILMSKRLDDTWVNWSEPMNLGYKYNTSGWDSDFSIPASGDYAYFVSTRKGGYGKDDIYRIKLSKTVKPKPVVLIYGKVLNAKTKEPIMSEILYETLPDGASAGTARSEPVNGTYKIVLPSGKNYGYRAEVKGFYAVSENLDVTELADYKEIERNLYLAPIEVNEVVRLNNIFFEFGKATLKPESFPELNRVVQLMKDNSTIEIEISGHTDNVGSDADNLKLSQDRAQAVVDYLTKNGVKSGRITAKGYGESMPVASNDTDEGRQYNRRVEFKVLKK